MGCHVCLFSFPFLSVGHLRPSWGSRLGGELGGEGRRTEAVRWIFWREGLLGFLIAELTL